MKIKPCPFCGKKPKLWKRKCSEAKYAFGCRDITCLLWIPHDAKLRDLQDYATCFVNKKNLIEAWNRREFTKPPKPKGMEYGKQ